MVERLGFYLLLLLIAQATILLIYRLHDVVLWDCRIRPSQALTVQAWRGGGLSQMGREGQGSS
jgi:hypothetical protein